MRLVKLTSWDDEDVFFVDGHWIVVDNEDHARSLIIAHNGLEIAVQGTPAEVAALLAGGEGDSVLAHLEGLLALYKDELHDRNGEVQSLTAEVERLRGERDEALCSWESEAADNASLRSEVERLKALNAALNAQVVEDTDHDVMALWEQAQDDVARVRKSMDRVATAVGIDTSSGYHADDVVGKIAALKRERDEARAALEALEWKPIDDEMGPFCPWCDNFQTSGHDDDCFFVTGKIDAPAPEPEELAPTELMGECPACGEPAPTSEFGVVEHMDGCGWCGHPSSDGDGQGGYVCLICDTTIAEPAGEAGDEGAGESGQTPGTTSADEDVSPPANGEVGPEPAPATPTEPTTTFHARSRIAIDVTGPCVVEQSPNSNVATVYIRPDGKVTATPPEGLELYATLTPDDVVWDDPMNKVLGPTRKAWLDVGTEYLWTRDPSRIGDKNYEYPEGACVVTICVVPEGDEWPVFPAPPAFDSFDPGPAFFDADAAFAFVQSDPEAWRQMTQVLNRPRNSTNWRQHQRANAGTPDAGLTPGGTGSQGWDLLGDVLCYGAIRRGIAIGGESIESVRDVIRSKLRDNWLRTRPFGIVGKDWDEGTPFRRTWARTSYRSFPDVLDEALALRFAFDDGTAAELLDAETLDIVLSDLRHFAAFVEADMAVSDPRMWRTANVLAVECVRHLFPSLGLPDLSGYLTRWDGDVTSTANSVLTPEDPPRWIDKGDYTAHHMMGVCYSVWAWIAEWRDPSAFPYHHIPRAIRIWTGIDGTWMWAKKTSAPQDGQDHRCARFTNSLTELWFPTGRDAVSLGSQDHAIYVVAGSRVAS